MFCFVHRSGFFGDTLYLLMVIAPLIKGLECFFLTPNLRVRDHCESRISTFEKECDLLMGLLDHSS